MKTIKVMGIIELVMAGLTLLVATTNNDIYNYTAITGWAYLLAGYSIAFGIVAIVQSKKCSCKNIKPE